MPDLRIHRPPYSLSLCIDDYGNEASLVTLTYTLFACSRSRLCAILYAAFTRPIILYTWRSGFISCLLIETLRLPRTARPGCLGNCQKALDTPSNEGGFRFFRFHPGSPILVVELNYTAPGRNHRFMRFSEPVSRRKKAKVISRDADTVQGSIFRSFSKGSYL